MTREATPAPPDPRTSARLDRLCCPFQSYSMGHSNFDPSQSVDAVPVIKKLDLELVRLLRSLPEPSWHLAAAGRWTVREVAAHLLDANLRRLSFCRDGLTPAGGAEPLDFDALVALLDRLNAEWITAARRLSPRVITDLLERTNVEVTDYFESLDPLQPAAFAVTWAGEAESPAWLDVAREFTEKWHHQQQIRAAVSEPGLTDSQYVEPLLRTLMFGVPHAYRNTHASDGTTLRVTVTDGPRLQWRLRREVGTWHLAQATGDVPAQASIETASEPLWKLMFREVPPDEVRRNATCTGPEELLDPFFSAVGVMVSRE